MPDQLIVLGQARIGMRGNPVVVEQRLTLQPALIHLKAKPIEGSHGVLVRWISASKVVALAIIGPVATVIQHCLAWPGGVIVTAVIPFVHRLLPQAWGREVHRVGLGQRRPRLRLKR